MTPEQEKYWSELFLDNKDWHFTDMGPVITLQTFLRLISTHQQQLTREEIKKHLDGFVKEVKDEFKDMNWDYFEFVIDRYLSTLPETKDKEEV